MTAIVITRNGMGSVWRHASLSDADEHPITQYGDPIITSEEDIVKKFNHLDYPMIIRFAESAGDEILEADLRSHDRGPAAEKRLAMRDSVSAIYAALTRIAKAPPEDPSEVVRIIVQDRIRSKKETRPMNDEQTTAEQTATEQTATEQAAAPKGRRTSRFGSNDVIHFRSDDKGVKYDPETNNPKRAGSRSHASFLLYKEGMTVSEFLAAGGRTRDVARDVRKKFIDVEAVAGGEDVADTEAGEGDTEE